MEPLRTVVESDLGLPLCDVTYLQELWGDKILVSSIRSAWTCQHYDFWFFSQHMPNDGPGFRSLLWMWDHRSSNVMDYRTNAFYMCHGPFKPISPVPVIFGDSSHCLFLSDPIVSHFSNHAHPLKALRAGSKAVYQHACIIQPLLGCTGLTGELPPLALLLGRRALNMVCQAA